MPFCHSFVVLYVLTHAHIALTITIQYARMPALSHYFPRMDNVSPLGTAILVAALAVSYLCFEPESHVDMPT